MIDSIRNILGYTTIEVFWIITISLIILILLGSALKLIVSENNSGMY